ncbi:MAG: serine/threonine-protein kinase [Cyanobacteria bacterium J06639_18]
MSLCINPKCQNPQNPENTIFCQSCGSELLLQGRYRVKRELGGGGFGKTYELINRTAENKVLKILINHHPKAIELFQREAEVLKILSHSGIPKVEADGYFVYFPKSQEQLHCLVMEKIEGLDLYEYIKQRDNRPIDEQLAIEWLKELTVILQQVHNQNFFHRDIKPPNIMLRSNGGLALIDFGTVRQVTGTYVAKQAIGEVTGVISKGYTPPEQINGQAMQQSDFFALGRTFVYLLTAQDPNQFYDPQTDELKWRDAVPKVSPQFGDFLDRMMARLPSQRPANTVEVLQQLTSIGGDTNLSSAAYKISETPSSTASTLLPNQAQLTESQNTSLQNTNLQNINSQNTSSQNTLVSANSDNRFLYKWVLGSFLGIGVGLFGRSLFSSAISTIWGSNIGFRYAVLSAVITWIPVESVQWLVLSQRLGWRVSFLLEIGFGLLCGLIVGTFIGTILFGLIGQMVFALLGAIAGSAISKWLILRQQALHQQIKNSFWWLIANVVIIPFSLVISGIFGVITNVALRILNSSFDLDLSSGLIFNLSFAMAMAIGITFYSIIAGTVLNFNSCHCNFRFKQYLEYLVVLFKGYNKS